MIEAFRDKYHTHVSLKPFKPEKLNESLNDRLVYRRIHTSFDITLRDYKAAKALYKANEGKRATGAKMDQEFIKWLNNSIVCGTDVLSFGSPVTFTNNTVQYEKEADLKGYEFRIRLTANRNFFIKNNDNAKAPCDVIGNLIMEFLIPVHKLLGVNFKCFLSFVDAQSSERKANEEETNNACNREILETLLRSNFTKVHDVYGKNEKLYFCFDFNDSKEHAAPDGFGTKVDYLYPQ